MDAALPVLGDDLQKDRARQFTEFLDDETGTYNYKNEVSRIVISV